MESETAKAAEDFIKSGGVQQMIHGLVTTNDAMIRVATIYANTVEEAIAIRDAQLPGLPLFLRVA